MASEFNEADLQPFIESLRAMLTGAWVRKAGEFRDLGELVLAKVGRPDDGPVCELDPDGTDVWVHFQGVLDDRPGTGKLFSIGNCFWRLPAKGSIVFVAKPSSATQIGGLDGPGIPLVFFGEGGPGALPASLDDTNTVLSPPTGELRLESRDDEVNLTSDTGNGKTVNANGTDYSGLKTETFESQLSTLLTDILTELAKGTSGSPVAQQLVGIATITAKITAFAAKLGNGTFESDKFKHG
jgi:hypothetical protein